MKMLLLLLCIFSIYASIQANQCSIRENDDVFDFQSTSTVNCNNFDLRQTINDFHTSYQWFMLSIVIWVVSTLVCFIAMVYLLYYSRF